MMLVRELSKSIWMITGSRGQSLQLPLTTRPMNKYLKAFIFALSVAFICIEATPRASNITVCASGCTYTNAQLQTAMDAAALGDTILLQSGAEYTGNFLMKKKTGCVATNTANYVTMRTGV